VHRLHSAGSARYRAYCNSACSVKQCMCVLCAGAITLASVGSSVGDPVDRKVVMSRFSSIGPVSDAAGRGGGRDSSR
jgi:hypothetical protein